MNLNEIEDEALALAKKFDAVERWASPEDVAALARLVAELCSQISSATDPRRFK